MAPITGLLDRDRSRAEVEADFSDVTAVVREMVDEGTALLARLLQMAAAETPRRKQHSALLLLLRHVVELTDAADELIRIGIFAPTALQVRAIIEAYMQMLYLAGKRTPFGPSPLPSGERGPEPQDQGGNALSGSHRDSMLEQRGEAYLVGDLRRQLQQAQGFQGGAVEPWLATLSGAGTVPAIVADAGNQASLAQEVARLQGELGAADHVSSNVEFDAARGTKKYDPTWFTLWGGPRTVRQLAVCVGLLGAYELFYGPASLVMHGKNIQGQLGTATAAGGHAPVALRYGRNRTLVHDVSVKLILHVVMTYKLVIEELRPSDDAAWKDWARRWTAVVKRLQVETT